MPEEQEMEIELIAELADGYDIVLYKKDNALQIRHLDDQGDALSTLVLEAADAYSYAQTILRGYDVLENIH